MQNLRKVSLSGFCRAPCLTLVVKDASVFSSHPHQHQQQLLIPKFQALFYELYLHKLTYLKKCRGASLVAQGLRIRLPTQGTRVQALVQEDPTCRGATKLVRHNY